MIKWEAAKTLYWHCYSITVRMQETYFSIAVIALISVSSYIYVITLFVSLLFQAVKLNVYQL